MRYMFACCSGSVYSSKTLIEGLGSAVSIWPYLNTFTIDRSVQTRPGVALTCMCAYFQALSDFYCVQSPLFSDPDPDPSSAAQPPALPEPGESRQASGSVPGLAGAKDRNPPLHAAGPSRRDERPERSAAATAGAPADSSGDRAAATSGRADGQGAGAASIPEACRPAVSDGEAAPDAASGGLRRGDDEAGMNGEGAGAVEATGLRAETAGAVSNVASGAGVERCDREWMLEHVRLP